MRSTRRFDGIEALAAYSYVAAVEALERAVHLVLLTMKIVRTAGAFASMAMGVLIVCCASPQGAASSPQPVLPGTEAQPPGVTNEQAVADSDVVERIAFARCDRSQSCNRIGTGAAYHDREDCMKQARTLVSKELNGYRCPDGIGEAAVARCVKSLRIGECDWPGQVYTTASHCKINELCLR